jgi:hypothetical protein
MKVDLTKYRIVELRDSWDGKILGAILLNYKDSVADFQNAVYKAKEKRREDIEKYGDDWTYISEELKGFDYIDVDYDDDYVEY